MERTMGFGLGDVRGELALSTRPINCIIRFLVASSAPPRQARAVAEGFLFAFRSGHEHRPTETSSVVANAKVAITTI